MRLVLAAFAFGVLIFFAGSAALSLEPPPQGPGIGHLSLLMLGTLQALTGLIAIAGAAPFLERRWGTIVGCATASVIASVVTVVAAMHLARRGGPLTCHWPFRGCGPVGPARLQCVRCYA